MSVSPTASPATARILRPSAFLNRLIGLLLPHFITVCRDLDEAHAEILETLASYGPRTRPELLNVARILAYSLAGLDLLAAARITDMTPSMRLRFHGSANNLDRASQQNEHTLNKRLAADPPVAAESPNEPADNLSDAEIDEQIREVQATLKANGYHPPKIPSRPSEAPLTPTDVLAQAFAEQGLPIPKFPPARASRHPDQPRP